MRRWSLTLYTLHDTKHPSLLYLPMAEYYNYWFVKQSVNRRWESLRGSGAFWPVNLTWETYLGKRIRSPTSAPPCDDNGGRWVEGVRRKWACVERYPVDFVLGAARDNWSVSRTEDVVHSTITKGVSNDRDSDHHVAIDFGCAAFKAPDRGKKSEGGELWRRHLRPHLQSPGRREGG